MILCIEKQKIKIKLHKSVKMQRRNGWTVGLCQDMKYKIFSYNIGGTYNNIKKHSRNSKTKSTMFKNKE